MASELEQAWQSTRVRLVELCSVATSLERWGCSHGQQGRLDDPKVRGEGGSSSARGPDGQAPWRAKRTRGGCRVPAGASGEGGPPAGVAQGSGWPPRAEAWQAARLLTGQRIICLIPHGKVDEVVLVSVHLVVDRQASRQLSSGGSICDAAVTRLRLAQPGAGPARHAACFCRAVGWLGGVSMLSKLVACHLLRACHARVTSPMAGW